MTPPASALVICTRRIGDVLLATPVMRSLAQTWPGIAVDALVFTGTEGILAANRDLRRVLTVPERPATGEHASLLARIWRDRLALRRVQGAATNPDPPCPFEPAA